MYLFVVFQLLYYLWNTGGRELDLDGGPHSARRRRLHSAGLAQEALDGLHRVQPVEFEFITRENISTS